MVKQCAVPYFLKQHLLSHMAHQKFSQSFYVNWTIVLQRKNGEGKERKQEQGQENNYEDVA